MLGLPDPKEKTLQDTKLISTYRDFCNSMSRDPADRFIKCDGNFFRDLDSWIKKKNFSRFYLLCALYHPNKAQTDNIRKRLSYFINYENQRGVFSGHVYSPKILSSYRQFLEFRNSSDYKTLTQNTVAGKTIGSVKAENSNAPVLNFCFELHISRYNKDWAVVLWWGDAEDMPLDAFPTILGFAGMDDLEKNVAALMIEEELFTMYGDFHEEGGVTDLVSLAWMRDGNFSDENFSYASFFLQFSDKELNHLRKEYGTLKNRKLLETVQEIYSYDEEIDLTKIAVDFGPPKGPGYFKELKVWLDKQLEGMEEDEANRIDELEEIAEPFEQEITCLLDTLLGKRPISGIADMQIYEEKKVSLRIRILEILQETGRLPTVAEIKSSPQKGK